MSDRFMHIDVDQLRMHLDSVIGNAHQHSVLLDPTGIMSALIVADAIDKLTNAITQATRMPTAAESSEDSSAQ